MPQLYWSVGMNMGHVLWLLVAMGGVTPGNMGLGYMRKVAAQAGKSKPVNKFPPCLCYSSCFQVPALLFYPDFTRQWSTVIFQIKPFLFPVVYNSNRSLTWTVGKVTYYANRKACIQISISHVNNRCGYTCFLCVASVIGTRDWQMSGIH